MTAHILPWLRAMARQAEVWVADPGRAYLPSDGLAAFATYRVPTTLELEDRTERQVNALPLVRLMPFFAGLRAARVRRPRSPSARPLPATMSQTR